MSDKRPTMLDLGPLPDWARYCRGPEHHLHHLLTEEGQSDQPQAIHPLPEVRQHQHSHHAVEGQPVVPVQDLRAPLDDLGTQARCHLGRQSRMPILLLDHSIVQAAKEIQAKALANPVPAGLIRRMHVKTDGTITLADKAMLERLIQRRQKHSTMLLIPVGYEASYSVEDQPQAGLMRHLSIAVMRDNLELMPSPEATNAIAELFGFVVPVVPAREDVTTMLWFEEFRGPQGEVRKAINIVQPLPVETGQAIN